MLSRVLILVFAFLAAAGPTVAAAQQGEAVGLTRAGGLDRYLLGPGDKLRIIVFNEPNLSGEYSVSDSGSIAFPLLGSVAVSGQTVPATQEAIRAMLADGFLNTPDVSLEVTKYRPYYIYGEIVRAGEYPFAAGLTLQQAIATAGGYSYRAARKHVFLRRSGESRETRVTLKSNPTLLVMPGDTVRIGERSF